MIRFLPFLCVAGLLAGCEKHDVGKLCTGAPATPVPSPADADGPIGGEQPVVEVVRTQRDGACESFQCLTHKGLSPYCTRSCDLEDPPEKAKRCSTDADCTGGGWFADGQQGHCDVTAEICRCQADTECVRGLQCFEGECRDDDCPLGFWCKPIHNAGTLAGELYCVAREGCTSDFDCEELGTMACRQLACHDRCLTDPSCVFHDLVCDVRNCWCCDGTAMSTDLRACADRNLRCEDGVIASGDCGSTSVSVLDGNLHRLDVCVRAD